MSASRIGELERELASGSFYKESDIDALQEKAARAEALTARLKEAVEGLRQAEEAVRLLEKGDTRFTLLSIAYGLREKLHHLARVQQEERG